MAEGSEVSDPEPPSEARRRLAIAVVALGGSGPSRPESSAVAPDPECVEVWNDDREARAIGRHDYSSHLYEFAEVIRIRRSGDIVAPEDPDYSRGLCAIIFARTPLDPETEAAGSVYTRLSWLPLSQEVDLDTAELAQLQEEALASANVALQEDGTFVSTVD